MTRKIHENNTVAKISAPTVSNTDNFESIALRLKKTEFGVMGCDCTGTELCSMMSV